MPDNYNIAVLVQRMDAMSEQLREHRDEAAGASERQSEKLDAIQERISRLESRTEAVDRLVRVIHGEGSELGLKIRQDRTERTVGVMVWAVAAIFVVVIGKFVEWITHLGSGRA